VAPATTGNTQVEAIRGTALSYSTVKAWVLVLAGALAPLQSGSGTTAEAVVRRVEAHLEQARDLTASFTQSYRSGLLGREIIEQGRLYVKRPGRMLWEYQKPERKTFLADGERYYFYVPDDRQVVVQERAGQRSAPALLLAGGAILEHFEAHLEEARTGAERLRLTPREPDPDLQRVYVDVDERDRVVGIEVVDAQGGTSRFRFSELRENVGLADGFFRLKLPKGVEVIEG
jgi:outer membrane lipoprotein carrier protein